MDIRNRIRALGAAVLCTVCSTATVTLAAPPMYRMHSLPAIADGDSMALGMNQYGVVVGWSQMAKDGERLAVSWRVEDAGISVMPLGTLGGRWSSAMAVNNHEQVVGVSEDWRGDVRGFYYYDGRMWSLAEIAEPAGGQDGGACDSILLAVQEVHAISDRGLIVGAGLFEGETALLPVVLKPRFAFAPDSPRYLYTALDVPSRMPYGVSCALNDFDQVAGMAGPFPAVWTTEMEALQWTAGQALAINNYGVVAGCSGASHPLACLWVDGERVDLEVPERWRSEALALNNWNEVVGHAWAGLERVPAAQSVMLWDADGTSWDLSEHTYVPIGHGDLVGFELYRATDINDRSEITGYGWTADGRMRAVWLEPLSCPE